MRRAAADYGALGGGSAGERIAEQLQRVVQAGQGAASFSEEELRAALGLAPPDPPPPPPAPPAPPALAPAPAPATAEALALSASKSTDITVGHRSANW